MITRVAHHLDARQFSSISRYCSCVTCSSQSAAPDLIPPPLIHQLKADGKMVIPAGLPDTQQLILAEKLANGRMTMKEILSVRFSLLEGAESG